MEIVRPEIRLDDAPYLAISHGEPLAIHCQYYNIFLQQTIEDPDYLDTRPILTNSATSVVYGHLSQLIKENQYLDTPEAILDTAASVFREFGHGLITLSESALSEMGGEVAAPVLHYGHSWKTIKGLRQTPVDFFAAGFIAAAMALAYGKPPGYYRVEEKQCVTTGDASCLFDISVAASPFSITPSPGIGAALRTMPAREKLTSNIDEESVRNAISSLPLSGNEEGLVPAFDVYLTRMYANYYNLVSYEFERLLVEEKGEKMKRISRALLEEAGHVCGLNFYGGVMVSPEWENLVMPMIQSREDWVHGITAVSNTLGWGRMTIKEFLPDEKLVMTVDGSYESNGYLALYGKGSESKCYLMAGGIPSIMNHLYHGDITKKPKLDQDYFDLLFKHSESFVGEETLCRCKGDSHCEVVVTRKKRR